MSFYNLINVVTKQHYLFIQGEIPFKKKLSPDQVESLHKQHGVPKKIITSATHIFNYDIKNYSIRDLKKLIFVLIGIPFEKQHLWVDNKSPSNDIVNSIMRRNKYDDTSFDSGIFTNFPQTLGYLYRGEEGIK